MRILALLILFSIGAAGQSRSGVEAGENSFTEGMMLFVLEDYAGALRQFESFVKVNAESGAGFYMKSRAERALEQFPKAELSAATAVELDGGNRYYLLNYAAILEKNHKGKAARNAWQQLIRMKPEDSDAYFHLLELQAGEGDSKEALKTLELVEKQFGTSEKVTRTRQLILLKENKVDAALKEGNKIAAENPEFLLHQAAILINSGQKKEAVELLEGAIGAHPDLADAHGLLSELYAGEKMEAASLTLLNQVMENSVLPYSLKVNVLGNHLRAFGENGAEDLLTKAELLIAAHPAQSRAYLYAGDLSFRLGRPLVAREHYSKALSLDKNQFEVWLALLQINHRLADFDRLEKDADNATIYFPNQPAIWLYLGWAQGQNDRADEAEIAFEEVIRLGGDPALKAGAEAGMAQIKGEATILESLLKNHPDNPYVRYFMIMHRLAAQAEGVLSQAASLSTEYPNNTSYKLLLAKVLVASGKGAEALKVLEFIPEEEALTARGYFDISGDALQLLGRSNEAQEAWKKALLQEKTNKTIQEKIKQI